MMLWRTDIRENGNHCRKVAGNAIYFAFIAMMSSPIPIPENKHQFAADHFNKSSNWCFEQQSPASKIDNDVKNSVRKGK